MIIKLKWDGEVGTINETEAFLAAEAIERHIGIFDLTSMLADPGKLKTAVVSRAYASLLSVAGISVSPDDVRKAILTGLKDQTSENRLAVFHGYCEQLLSILTDEAEAGGGNEGNDPPPA